jgi:hypothetical protein
LGVLGGAPLMVWFSLILVAIFLAVVTLVERQQAQKTDNTLSIIDSSPLCALMNPLG